MNFLETYKILGESNFVSIDLNKRMKILGWSNVACGSCRPKASRGWNPLIPIYSILHIFFTM